MVSENTDELNGFELTSEAMSEDDCELEIVLEDSRVLDDELNELELTSELRLDNV